MQLYRLYNAEHILLYVGISFSAIHRQSTHQGKIWWHEVSYITIENLNSNNRYDAETYEDNIINSEFPRYNIDKVRYNKNDNELIDNSECGACGTNFDYEYGTADEDVVDDKTFHYEMTDEIREKLKRVPTF